MADQENWWAQDAQAPTGDAFLSTLDPARASQVKALAEGRMELPKGPALRSAAGATLLADVAQYDPKFDAANAPARIAARKAFTSGKQGQNISAFNTALGHLGTLAQRAEELDNSGIPIWNSIANSVESATGDPRVSNFQIARQAVADELTRAFRGSGGNVHDIKGWEAAINSAQSPQQLRGAIGQAAELLGSRISALQDQYNQSINSTTADPLPLLNPHAMEALQAFQNKDYQDKGYQAVAALMAPGAGDGGNDQGGGLTPPSSGGTAAPNGPQGGGPAPLAPDQLQISDGTSQAVDQSATQPIREQIARMVHSGSSANDIRAYLQQQGINPTGVTGLDELVAWRAKHPDYKGGYTINIGPQNIELSGPQKWAATVAGSAPGAAVIGAANTGLFGALPKITAGTDAVLGRLSGDNRSVGDLYDAALKGANFKVEASREAHPVAALIGDTAGFLAGDAALGALPYVKRLAQATPSALRPIVGDALFGAATGVGSSDSLSEIPKNVAAGAALSAAGGVLGRGAVKGVANVVSPAIGGAVRRLTDAGVTLTPGQVLGGSDGFVGRAVKGIEDRLTGFSGVGDVINATRRGGVEDFNRAAINDALRPIGESADGIGHAGIADMQQKASAAIDRALAPINAGPDTALVADIGRANRAATRQLSSQNAKAYDRIVEEHVEPYLRGSTITGDGIKSIKQGLDGEIANLRGQGSSPQDRKLADTLDRVRDSFLDFADRVNPTSAGEYAKAREAYGLAKRVEAAAAKAKDGVFTPNQFRQAVVKRGYGTTTARVARGEAPFQQLATDASTILPSSVSDSGTAGRVALAAAVTRAGAGGVLGGGAGYEQGGAAGALGGALAGSALLSRPGARAFQYLAAGSRGKQLNTLGAVLRRNAELGGAVGTPLLLSNLPNNGN